LVAIRFVLALFPRSLLKPWDSWETLLTCSSHRMNITFVAKQVTVNPVNTDRFLLFPTVFMAELAVTTEVTTVLDLRPLSSISSATPLQCFLQTHEDEKNDIVKCRFYESHYPSPEELVVVKVTDVGDMGAYAKLLEYGDIEGFILLPEIGRRRIRSKAMRLKVNRVEVVRVIRVDKEKGSYKNSVSQ